MTSPRSQARPSAAILRGAAGLVVLAVSIHSSNAAAEPTTWLSVGGGMAAERHALTGNEIVPVFSAAVGVGTDPNGSFSIGGLFRSTTYFGIGTELALGPRLATSGFTRGGFGFAFDLGVAARPYGRSDYGRLPLQGGITVGFPWGVQLETGARVFDLSGQPSALGGFVTLGVDLLRLTVHRRGKTEQVWPNPAAAGAPLPKVAPLPGEEGADEGLGPVEPGKPADKPSEPVDDAPEPTLR